MNASPARTRIGSGKFTQPPSPTVAHALKPGRHAWLQVLRGRPALNGQPLGAGDGAAGSAEERLETAGQDATEVLLFDLA